MLKKSYTGPIVWMIVFIGALTAFSFLPFDNTEVLMRVILLLMGWGIAVLAFIIWRTEQVYWYNRTSYKEAAAADSERRKAFAWKHLRVFGGYALGLSAFVALMHLLGASAWIDFTVGTVGLVAAACFTIPIKL